MYNTKYTLKNPTNTPVLKYEFPVSSCNQANKDEKIKLRLPIKAKTINPKISIPSKYCMRLHEIAVINNNPIAITQCLK
ncbi:hypothetical protein GCM10025882_02520 [Acinetobacter gyllenbergii]|nr:hypothetical protein GCM10025882_02520 [Acinetobacter gyllenbergii]